MGAMDRICRDEPHTYWFTHEEVARAFAKKHKARCLDGSTRLEGKTMRRLAARHWRVKATLTMQERIDLNTLPPLGMVPDPWA